MDTTIVSMLYRGTSDHRYPFYSESLRYRRALISFQTLEEGLFGAIDAGWGARRQNAFERYLSNFEVVWSDERLVEISAQLRSDSKQAGGMLTSGDAWVAATAMLRRCPVASDDRDFEIVPNLRLISRHIESSL